jgi:hypothetical protein
MTAGEILVKLVASVVCGAIPFGLLFVTCPPTHGDWLYPNPGRWDYHLKLLWYAVVASNTPSQPAARWFARVIVCLVIGGMLTCIWLLPSCR